MKRTALVGIGAPVLIGPVAVGALAESARRY